MSTPSAFITWQPVLTDHQAYTYLALQELSGISVISIVTSREDAVRKQQGWTETRVDVLARELVPVRGWLSFFYHQLRKHRDAVHIFASPFQQPKMMLALVMAALLGVEFYLISEPYSRTDAGYYGDGKEWAAKLKNFLRPIFYRFYILMLGRRLSGIFAISRMAEAQYLRAGVAPGKIIPFGYFVPAETSGKEIFSEDRACTHPRFVFVGSLIRRKGIDLLVQAMQELDRRGVRCLIDFYGPGDPVFLENCPGSRYCGAIPFGGAQAVIAHYDLLVLPSRHDGWGVVVNEAVCAGVPVLCSDATGAGHAASMLGAGRLFESENVESLVTELELLILRQDVLGALRSATPAAANSLQPDVAAAYMLENIFAPEGGGAKPSPWYGAPA